MFVWNPSKYILLISLFYKYSPRPEWSEVMVHINVNNFFYPHCVWHTVRGNVDNFFWKKSGKKFGFVKMSVTFADGDNPFTGFWSPLCIHFPPLSTTTIGHDDSVKTNLSPL
jgi:hypothetical protein